MNRRDFIKGCVVGVSALAGSGLESSRAFASEGKKPNVVLIVADDHGLDAVGCYGNPVVKTPNLDRLAAEGVRFTHAFCTTASCSASRSVILTGLYNHANGQYGHEHSYHHFISFDNIKSLPVLMKEAGYRTARIGKYHVAPEGVYKFESALPGDSRSPVGMAENCNDFIASNDARPFFLYFCTSDPHRGGGVAEDLPYKPDRFGNRPKGYPGVKEVKFDPKDVVVPAFLPDSPQCRAELAQYYQSVSRVDQGVGRLIEVLRDAGKYDNTIIIYISDNGVAFAGAKTTLYEPGMNLPCLVRSPHPKKRGLVCNAMITWADLTPTILDFAGALSGKTKFHGRSFKSVLDQESPKGLPAIRLAGWDEIYASHTFHEITMYYPMRVVRQRRFKLIWNIAHGLSYPFASDLWESATWQATLQSGAKYYGKRSVEAYLHRPEFELYDLQQDPDEVQNLADSPEHANVLAELKTKLKAFQSRTNDPWIVKWQHE
jgi:N-sulfoglucosamine sulfohydrolase